MLASMSIDHPLCPPVDGVKRAQVNTSQTTVTFLNITAVLISFSTGSVYTHTCSCSLDVAGYLNRTREIRRRL